MQLSGKYLPAVQAEKLNFRVGPKPTRLMLF